MKATDFRIGNYIHYHIEDEMDERKEWDELSQIDYDDLRCLTQYEDNSEYRPIPLTEEWLVKLGFKKFDHIIAWPWKVKSQGVCARVKIYVQQNGHCCVKGVGYIEYVHTLQNLYWCLCGEELKIN